MNKKNKKNRENTAPFIGLVPIPSLTIDCVDVDFQMEVTDTDTGVTTFDISEDNRTNISSEWFGVKIEQYQSEGLTKLKEIMDAYIEPIPKVDKNGE